MHRTTQGEVRLDIEFQILDDGTLATPTMLPRLGIQNELVEQREPVTRRRF